MDGGEHIFFDDLLTYENSILEVVSLPWHERDQHIAAEGKLPTVGGRPVGDDIAFGDAITFLHNRSLVDAGSLVGSNEFLQPVDVLHRPCSARHAASAPNDDALGRNAFHRTAVFGHDDGSGIFRGNLFETGSDDRRICYKERHCLALHIGSHECAVCIIMFEERYQRGGHTHELFRGNIHVLHLFGGHQFEIAQMPAEHQLVYKIVVFVQRGVRLRDHKAVLFVGRKILYLLCHSPFLDFSVRGFKEAILVDLGIGAQRRHKPDIGTFRCFYRTDSPVVCGMHVAHLETGPLTAQAPRPEGAQAALVGEFGQRVRLVHEVGQLAAAEKVLYHGAHGFGVDKVLRCDGVHLLEVHALFDGAFHADESDANLVREQLSHGSNAPVAEMVDVINLPLVILEPYKIADGFYHIFGTKRERLHRDVEIEFPVYLVPADRRKIVARRIEEGFLEQRPGRLYGRGITGTDTSIHFNERVIPGLYLVGIKRFQESLCLVGRLEFKDSDIFHALFLKGGQHAPRYFLPRSGNDFSGALVHDIPCQQAANHALDIKAPSVGHRFHLAETNLFDLVEKAEDLFVVLVSQCPQKRGCRHTSAPVDMHIDYVVDVGLEFHPCAPVGYYPSGKQHAAAGMLLFFETDAGRAVQLAHDDPLGAIDDEGSFLGHERQFADEDILLFYRDWLLVAARHFLVQHKPDLRFERCSVSHAALLAFGNGIFGRTERIVHKLE